MNLEDRIALLIEQWNLDEIFEMCDITPEAVLLFLYEHGQIDLPEFLQDRDSPEGEEV